MAAPELNNRVTTGDANSSTFGDCCELDSAKVSRNACLLGVEGPSGGDTETEHQQCNYHHRITENFSNGILSKKSRDTVASPALMWTRRHAACISNLVIPVMNSLVLGCSCLAVMLAASDVLSHFATNGFAFNR